MSKVVAYVKEQSGKEESIKEFEFDVVEDSQLRFMKIGYMLGKQLEKDKCTERVDFYDPDISIRIVDSQTGIDTGWFNHQRKEK